MPEPTIEDLAARVAELEGRVNLPRRPVGHKTLPPTGTATFESLLGAGEKLWDTDEEFDQFLDFVRRVRQG